MIWASCGRPSEHPQHRTWWTTRPGSAVPVWRDLVGVLDARSPRPNIWTFNRDWKKGSQLVISPCFILCERINIIVSSTMYNYLLCNPNPKLSKLLYDKWNISKRVHYEYTSFAVHKMGRAKITDICVGLWLITPCGSVDISWYIQHPTVDLLLSYWSWGPRFESQTRDNSNSYGHLLVIYIYNWL